MVLPRLKNVLLFFVAVLTFGGAEKATNDQIFGEYLLEKMNHFSTWVADNGLDPFAPMTGKGSFRTRYKNNVDITCQIRDQFMSGHWLRGNGEVEAESRFEDHEFDIYCSHNRPFHIFATLSCEGKVISKWYSLPHLKEDVYFSGKAVMNIIFTEFDEYLEMTNVGITENHNLNFTESKVAYDLDPTKYHTSLHNVYWNDTSLNEDPFLDDIRREIENAYVWSLEFGEDQRSPRFQMFKLYVDHFRMNLTLRDLMSEQDLPEPYYATPAPPTLPPTTKIANESTVTRVTEYSDFETGFHSLLHFRALGALSLTLALFLLILRCELFKF